MSDLLNLVCCTCKSVTTGVSEKSSCPKCEDDRIAMGGYGWNTPIFPDATEEWWDDFIVRLKQYHDTGGYRRYISRRYGL